MPATTSWADKLKIANEGAVKLQPLELGEKNFEVAKAEVRQSAASGNSYLSIQAKVIDGPQANARPTSPALWPRLLGLFRLLVSLPTGLHLLTPL